MVESGRTEMVRSVWGIRLEIVRVVDCMNVFGLIVADVSDDENFNLRKVGDSHDLYT